MKKLMVAAILAAVVLVPMASAATVLSGAKAALADKDLTLADMLTYALQDERIARTEYQVILGTFGSSRPFSNIIKAEESHIRYLVDLFADSKLAVPADDTAKPAAPKDWASAIEAGRQAEIDNIAMYDTFLARDLPADVRQVFEQLKAASQNHLRAFTNNSGRN
jgi:rubrerythrin